MNVQLPDIIDPVLTYLAETLPPAIYSLLIEAISHCLTLVTSLYMVISSLLSTNPLDWNVQRILPPIITLFMAYLALLSFYRTTTWMLRTSIFFVKWGTFFGLLIAGTAWFLGNGSGNGLGRYGFVAGIGNILLDLINGKGKKNASGSTRSHSYTRTSRSRTSEQQKPKPWDSFEQHREWQYQEEGTSDSTDAQEYINNIISSANKFFQESESRWWNVVKGVVDSALPGTASSEKYNEEHHPMQQPQSRTKAGRSRSR